MNIVSTAEMSYRSVTTKIESEINKTRSKFQADQTKELDKCGIKIVVIKQTQKWVQQMK